MKTLFLLAALAASLPASILQTPYQSSGGGTLTSATITNPSPNNNNPNSTGQSPNLFTIVESIASIPGPFGIGFAVNPSSASTEYFVTKTITNTSLVAWTSFTVGVGCNDGLTRCSGFDPLLMDYDIAPTNSIGGASLSTIGPVSFTFSNFNLAPSSTMTITFSMDTCAQCTGGWLLQEIPGSGVPEPATYALTGTAMLGLGYAARRRR